MWKGKYLDKAKRLRLSKFSFVVSSNISHDGVPTKEMGNKKHRQDKEKLLMKILKLLMEVIAW
jgi:hypothetical protein